MKKLTFLIFALSTLCFSTKASAADGDTITYDLTSDGVWSNPDRSDGFYSTWTSDDSLLTMTSDATNNGGSHIGFQTQTISGYPMIRVYPGYTEPATIVFKPAEGYRILSYSFEAISNWNKSYTHTFDRGDTVYSVTPSAWTTVSDSVAHDSLVFKLTASNNDIWSDMMIYYASGSIDFTIVKKPVIKTFTYDISKDGAWTNTDDVSGLYSTWTSNDGLVSITSDAVNGSGQHIGFGIYAGTTLRCFPGAKQPATIAITAAKGYLVSGYYLYAESNGYHSWTTTLTRDDGTVYSLTNAAWVAICDSTLHKTVSFKLASSDNDLWSDFWIYDVTDYQYITIQTDPDPTGIENAVVTDETVVNDNAVYDLQGRRVLNPQKGIYIRNHKKFILK